MKKPSPARFPVRALHALSGLVLAAFVVLHLVNHALMVLDPALAFAFMDAFRLVYRRAPVEALLLASVLFQMATGAKLARWRAADARGVVARISGLYLLLFLAIHIAAVMWARIALGVDTGVHFAAAGLRTWPASAFFVPYYSLAVIAVCVHAGIALSRRLESGTGRAAIAVSAVTGILLAGAIVGGMITA